MAYHRVTSGVRWEGATWGPHRGSTVPPPTLRGQGWGGTARGEGRPSLERWGRAGRSGLRLGGVGLGVELFVEGVAQVGEGGAQAGRGNGRGEGRGLGGSVRAGPSQDWARPNSVWAEPGGVRWGVARRLKVGLTWPGSGRCG